MAAQVRRILFVIELVAPLRRGATAAEIQADISADWEAVPKRTVYRDLNLLIGLGLIERIVPAETFIDGVRQPERYLWADRGVRGAILRNAAELIRCVTMQSESSATHPATNRGHRNA